LTPAFWHSASRSAAVRGDRELDRVDAGHQVDLGVEAGSHPGHCGVEPLLGDAGEVAVTVGGRWVEEGHDGLGQSLKDKATINERALLGTWRDRRLVELGIAQVASDDVRDGAEDVEGHVGAIDHDEGTGAGGQNGREVAGTELGDLGDRLPQRRRRRVTVRYALDLHDDAAGVLTDMAQQPPRHPHDSRCPVSPEVANRKD